jgi:ribosomal protein S18 acetylase RimI-like enzyme
MLMEIRVAVPSDEVTILALIRVVAAEIPILIEPDDRWRLVQQMVQNHCAGGESWVAVGDDGAIAGFLLAEPDQVERFLHDDGSVYLAYAAVAPAARGMGTFTALARQAMGMQVPLTATVKRGNTSNMVGRFQRLGFVISAERPDDTALAWRPGG